MEEIDYYEFLDKFLTYVDKGTNWKDCEDTTNSQVINHWLNNENNHPMNKEKEYCGKVDFCIHHKEEIKSKEAINELLNEVDIMDKNINKAIKELTKKQTVSLWGDELEFTPVIASEIVGDGKQILKIWALSQRPQFWLIQIDSKADINDDDFDIEKYLEIIEDEFGTLDDDVFDSDIEIENLYPSIYWDGGLWESVYNRA